MILSKQDCELFFSVYDVLTDYANGKWGIAPAVIDARSGYVNEENQRKVAAEVWRNLSIIDELIVENPFAMPEREMDVLRGWRNAYTDSFYVVQKQSKVVHFIAEDVAFEVCGLSREIISMLNAMPTVVTATLLPFDDKIVYAVYLEEQPMLFGRGMQALIDDAWNEIASSGNIIATAEQLSSSVKDLEEKRISREAQRMLNSLEAEMKPDFAGEGAHRGVLADLPEKEREEAVETHAYVYSDAEQALAALGGYCDRRDPKYTLAELLMSFTQEEIVGIAQGLGLKPSSGAKSEIVASVVSAATSSHSILALLSGMDFEDYEKVVDLYGKGGRLSVPADKMRSVSQFYAEVPLVIHPFLHEGVFTFVIPDEINAALKNADWKLINQYQKQNKLLISIANFLVELRGVCSFQEVFDIYMSAAGDDDSYEAPDALSTLAFTPREDLALYTIWMGESPEATYLVHADLARSFGDGSQGAMPQRLQTAELPVEIDELLSIQQDKQPRNLSEEMLSIGEYVIWARTRPAAVALREWLDAHVPDDADDYIFANGVVDDLIVMCTQEFPMSIITRYLSDTLIVSDEHQLEKVMVLFGNLNNTLPKWSNNGWSPNELREGKGDRKVFYNEDGSAKRIGPFDPCPCGSGKAYKDCHGK